MEQSMDWLNKIEEIYNKIKESNQCLCINDLAITGDDLKRLGMTEGKELGDMLKYLFHKVLERPELNNMQDLLLLVKRKLL
jgi:tRNA nucleotidyltransferase (CCA-adding enzyme)